MYRKLKDEIADGIQRGRISSPITSEEARRLPYLQACICEGMRMMPTGLIGFAKKVPPEGDIICGKPVPGGTEIFANMWDMLRDKDVFGADAHVFRPERFVDCEEEKGVHLLKHVELIFGYGRWMCPGQNLAKTELNKIFVEVS